jgi:hypothetical protein
LGIDNNVFKGKPIERWGRKFPVYRAQDPGQRDCRHKFQVCQSTLIMFVLFCLVFTGMTMLFHRKSNEYAIGEGKKQALNAFMNSADFTSNCSLTSSRINTMSLPHSPQMHDSARGGCAVAASITEPNLLAAVGSMAGAATGWPARHCANVLMKQFSQSPMLFFNSHIWIKTLQIGFFLKSGKAISR